MKSNILTHDEYVNNILAYYHMASASQKRRGRNWYRRMTIIVQGYAIRNDITPYMAAGIYGAYSINNSWKDNIRRARNILRNGAVINGLPVQRKVAHAALAGIRMEDILSKDSHKVKRFVRNISGDYSCVTVDRHANRVARNDMNAGVPSGKEYLAIESAYITAAAIVGELPAELQAITWLVISRKAH